MELLPVKVLQCPGCLCLFLCEDLNRYFRETELLCAEKSPVPCDEDIILTPLEYEKGNKDTLGSD